MDLNVCVPRRYSRYRRTERVVVMTHAYICVHAIRCTCWRNTGTRYSRYGSSENKLAIYNKSSTTQLTQRSLQSPLPSFFSSLFLSFLSSHFLSLRAFNCPITRFPRVQDVVRLVGEPVSNESRFASPKHFCNDAGSLNNERVLLETHDLPRLILTFYVKLISIVRRRLPIISIVQRRLPINIWQFWKMYLIRSFLKINLSWNEKVILRN